MKTKFIVVSGILAAVAVIGTFIGRSVWDRRHQLVSLHVRNAPLGEVIQKLERQTGQKIAVDRKLDGLVTLDMTRKPLATVLDRVGEQCGASWRTVHAVYGSALALPALESSLYGDKRLDEAGWKLIAPGALNGLPMDLPDGKQIVLTNLDPAGLMQAAGGNGGGPVRVIVKHGADGSAPQVVTDGNAAELSAGATIATEDATANIGTNGSGAGAVKMKKQAAPVIMRMVRKKGDGTGSTAVEEEIWTPVEVVLESRLEDQLSSFSGAPTFEAAQEAARKVNGCVKTYYALRKSSFAMGMPGMSFNSGSSGGGRMIKSGDGTVQGKPGGTNVFKMGRMPSTGELEAMVAQRRSDELGKLTPEQRVQRARDRQQPGHNQ
jgi:hypothetical protein